MLEYSETTTNALIACFKAILAIIAFVNGRYYRGMESDRGGLEMVLNQIYRLV